MTNKNQKKYAYVVLITIFLYIGFFCMSINKISAKLEVAYPTITVLGQSSGSVSDLPSYIKYLFVAGMSIGVGATFVSLAIAGVMYFLSPINAEAQAAAKDRASGAISGLLIIVLTYLIITTINPQLNAFNFNKLNKVSVPDVKNAKPGVYFYKDGCDDNSQPNAGSISNLGALKNQIHSVKIVPDEDNGTYYVSILYQNPDFWGKCQYINPNNGCQSVEPFASSASIHVYDPEIRDGGGVYFYRKSCFNDGSYNDIDSLIAHCNKDSGGYYEAQASGGIYIKKLDDLTFEDVPKDEQKCTQYDKNGDCCIKSDKNLGCDKDGRVAQTLGGQNISSMIINGNYVVLLVYFAENDNSDGPWTSCQEFPTDYEQSRIGPRQIKWQNIRNTSAVSTGGDSGDSINLGGIIPNYVVIIPIK